MKIYHATATISEWFDGKPDALFGELVNFCQYAAVIPTAKDKLTIDLITTSPIEALTKWQLTCELIIGAQVDAVEEEWNENRIGQFWGAIVRKAERNSNSFVWPIRLEPIEALSRRELLGLTAEAFGEIYGASKQIVDNWESGKQQVPFRVALLLDNLEAATENKITSLISSPNQNLVAYRTTEKLREKEADIPPWATAKWWRQTVARAHLQKPSQRIASPKQNNNPIE